MEIIKVSETTKKNSYGVDTRPIYRHKHAQVIVLTLQPGESLKQHITPVDVFP